MSNQKSTVKLSDYQNMGSYKYGSMSRDSISDTESQPMFHSVVEFTQNGYRENPNGPVLVVIVALMSLFFGAIIATGILFMCSEGKSSIKYVSSPVPCREKNASHKCCTTKYLVSIFKSCIAMACTFYPRKVWVEIVVDIQYMFLNHLTLNK